MEYVSRHRHQPDVAFDGGSLDCGSGLLLLIRRHIDPLPRGGLLEIRSTDATVVEDLPAWCRLTGNELLSTVKEESYWSYLVCKGTFVEREASAPASPPIRQPGDVPATATPAVATLPAPQPAPDIPPLAVMGIGSWPRPRWMLQAIHEHVSGRLSELEFQETANDAVRLCVESQLKAGVDVITDGEQRRDSYASFVGGRLDNCQLIPITDLLPYVEDPAKFAEELRALDVPAGEVRHPAVFGPLRRSRSLAVHELQHARTLTDKPVKVALPGPYLLTRTMWLECVSDRAYSSREALAADIVQALREELFHLLAEGAAVVQFDEPVLTEVVFGAPSGRRSFMCGALSEKRSTDEELAFAGELLNQVVNDAPRNRTAIHICRGNWSRNEAVALRGNYVPLVPLLCQLQVGNYFLELCTPRAGELEVLSDLPRDRRIGIGSVNQKLDRVESVEEILEQAQRAVRLFGAERVMLSPDCGFATFADNPVASAEIARQKLAALVEASRRLRYI